MICSESRLSVVGQKRVKSRIEASEKHSVIFSHVFRSDDFHIVQYQLNSFIESSLRSGSFCSSAFCRFLVLPRRANDKRMSCFCLTHDECLNHSYERNSIDRMFSKLVLYSIIELMTTIYVTFGYNEETFLTVERHLTASFGYETGKFQRKWAFCCQMITLLCKVVCFREQCGKQAVFSGPSFPRRSVCSD